MTKVFGCLHYGPCYYNYQQPLYGLWMSQPEYYAPHCLLLLDDLVRIQRLLSCLKQLITCIPKCYCSTNSNHKQEYFSSIIAKNWSTKQKYYSKRTYMLHNRFRSLKNQKIKFSSFYFHIILHVIFDRMLVEQLGRTSKLKVFNLFPVQDKF